MPELLLGLPVADCCSEDGGDEGVGADALGGGLLLHRVHEVDGEFDQLLGGLGHLQNHTACYMVGATEKQGSRRANAQPSYSRRYIR